MNFAKLLAKRFGLLPSAVVGIVLLCAFFAIVAQMDRTGAEAAAANPTQATAAEARALGARWRANRSVKAETRYAEVLMKSGLYDELLSEIRDTGLLASDAALAAMFSAEAMLRQGRYAEALAVANQTSAGNAHFAFVRARAFYALTPELEEAKKHLSLALRGPGGLSAEAWLFRARLALDANDLETAQAAARRAVEYGGDLSAAHDVAIEAAIRRGNFHAIAGEVDARLHRILAAGDTSRSADLRLAAMILLKKGDARAAARLLDEARFSGAELNRGTLLLALAKWLSGDGAQAYALVSKHLDAAPRDWMALDLAVAIARDIGRSQEADALIERLSVERPALALYRHSDQSVDEAFKATLALGGNLCLDGVGAALLGERAGIRGLPEAGADFRRLILLAASLDSADAAFIRKKANAVVDAPAAPIGLLVAGVALLQSGDADRAANALQQASAAAPSAFTPVRIRAELLVNDGDPAAAAALLGDFVKANAANDDARLALAKLQARNGDLNTAAETFATIAPGILFADEAAAVLYADAAAKSGIRPKGKMLSAAREAARSALILGKVEAASGDVAAAASTFRRGLIDDPLHEDLPAAYLDAMGRLHRDEEARSFLAEIVRRRPAASAARNALAVVTVESGAVARF